MDDSEVGVGVEEDEGCADLGGDAEAERPGERWRVVLAVEAVLKASVGKEVVHESPGFRADTYEADQVWVSQPTQNINL